MLIQQLSMHLPVQNGTGFEQSSGKCCRGWEFYFIYVSFKTFQSALHCKNGLLIDHQDNAKFLNFDSRICYNYVEVLFYDTFSIHISF